MQTLGHGSVVDLFAETGMHHLAVHWHEGLFLRPQHLQAWDRHWQESATASERWQNPHSYGLAKIDINSDALDAGFFQIDSLRAKMLDGTLIDLSSSGHPQRIDLREAFARAEANEAATLSFQGGPYLDVYLAVPRLQLGQCNVESSNQGGARFHQLQQEIPDDSDGNSVEPILFRRINATLLLSTDDHAGHETLRIARVIRRNQGGNYAEIDASYTPPLLDCAAWPGIRQHILMPIADLIHSKITVIAQLIRNHSSEKVTQSATDLGRMLVLQTLNQTRGVLEVLLRARGIHPFQAYIELCRLAGGLDILTPDLHSPTLAPYDHEAIGPLFLAARERIEQRLSQAGTVAYESRFFIGSNLTSPAGTRKGLQVAIPSDWFAPNASIVLGIHRGELSPQELERLLTPGNLDWKIGSVEQVDILFTQRAPGVEIRPLKNIPASLPTTAQWSYFQLQASGPAWADCVRTGTIAIRIREQLLANSEQILGSKLVQLRARQGNLSLQFACFFNGTTMQ